MPLLARRFAAVASTLFSSSRNFRLRLQMGRRQYKRLRISLPVKVSGVDTNGNRFTQSATTVDIGIHGVRLRGIRCFRAPGELVEVAYKDRRARYRVTWIGMEGPCQGRVGLEGLQGARFLFSEHLPPDLCSEAAEIDSYVLPGAAAPPDPAPVDHAAVERRNADRRQGERRRFLRYNCAGTARICEDGGEIAADGRINEISFGGCYVETMSPARVGTRLQLELAINGPTIRLEAIVRLSQPTCGMGVEFSRIAAAEAEKLHRVVTELSGRQSSVQPTDQPTEPAPIPAMQLDRPSSSRLGQEVLRWFASHDALTRQDFLNVVEQVQLAGEQCAPADWRKS